MHTGNRFKSITEKGILRKIAVIAVFAVVIGICGALPSSYIFAEDGAQTQNEQPGAQAQSTNTQVSGPSSDEGQAVPSAQSGSSDQSVPSGQSDASAAGDQDNAGGEEANTDVSPTDLQSEPALTKSMSPAANEEENKPGNTVRTHKELVDAIENAEDGVETVITIADYIEIQETIRIGKNKIITLVNDGQDRNLHPNHSKMPMPLIIVDGILNIECIGDDSLFRIHGEDQEVPGVPENSNNGKATAINVNGTLNFKGGTIIGNTVRSSSSGAVVLSNGAVMNMSGGVIKGTRICEGDTKKSSYSRDYTGAVVVGYRTTFNMTGGVIEDNKSYAPASSYQSGQTVYTTPAISGGAICVSSGTVNISGDAVIRDNYSEVAGAIYMFGSAKVNISGGVFQNNTSFRMGGAIVTASPSSSLNISAGRFDGNYTSGNGGAIWSYGENTTITGGLFVNNSAGGYYGGAISIADDVNSFLHLKNAIIRNNEASVYGGGIWLCPTGSIQFEAKEGVAIYDNKAGVAGDDFSSVAPILEEGKRNRVFYVYLSETILGGERAEYYNDGKIVRIKDDDVLGEHDPSVPRFDPENPGEKVQVYGDIEEGLALKAIVSDSAKARYDDLAKRAEAGEVVLFEKNKASRGGAIGGNSNVINTEEKTDPSDAELTVEKIWADDIKEEEIPEEIEVDLLLNDKVIDSIKLTKNNEWKATFKGLIKDELDAGNYTVKERAIKGFTPEYNQVTAIEGEEKAYGVIILNTKTPEEVKEETEEPKKPEVEKNIEPEEEKDGSEVKGAEDELKKVAQVKTSSKTPTRSSNGGTRTGDNAFISLMIVLMILAAAACGYVIIRRRRG